MRHPSAEHVRSCLHFHEEDGLLRVRVEGGADSQQVRIAYWQEMVAEAKRVACRRLLVMDRKKGRSATPTELAELAMLFRAEAVHFDAIAVVEPNSDFIPVLEHGEIVARMVGINLRIFADVRSAEHWLHYGWKEAD